MMTRLLSRIVPGLRRQARELERLRLQHAKARSERNQYRQERDILRAKVALRNWAEPLTYQEDGLATIHNASFLQEPAFQAAYAAGVAAADEDYHWRWRVHVGLWAARHAVQLPGDFVECGVHRGFLSRAIIEQLRWAEVSKTFWLLDTFAGLVDSQISPEERNFGRRAGEEGRYRPAAELVRQTFADWPNVRIIEGAVPETLAQVTALQIAYLSLDMNCAAPEIAAGEWAWSRLAAGAVVLLDDYAYAGYTPQKIAWDEFAARWRVPILTLPTGQGLFLKPAAPS